jgi:hypothetical protein
MATPPNAQQLLLIKELFGDAQALASRDDTFSTSKGILLLDLSVELMLRAIIYTLVPNLNPKKDLYWQDLWKQADAALKLRNSQLNNYAPLKTLHDHRNMVQHAGAVYHFSQAQMHVPPVEDMLSHAFKDVYGLNFSSYSLLGLIANDDLRKWLQDTEQLLNEGGPVLAIAACKFVHRLVIGEVRRSTRKWWPADIRPRGLDSIDLVSTRPLFREIREHFDSEFEALEQEVTAIGVGLSILEARRFRTLGGYVQLTVALDGTWHLNIGPDRPFEENKEAAEFMLGYLSRLIRYIEQTFGSALQSLKIEVPLMEQGLVKNSKPYI